MIKRALYGVLSGCAILGGCHSIPLWELVTKDGLTDAGDPGPPGAVSVRPTIQNPAANEFVYVPTKTKRTSRANLFRLVDATNAAQEALGFEKPYPLIRIVDAHSPNLSNPYAMATSTVTDEGKEIMYFNRSYLESGAPLEGTMIHEYSHFVTWRQYGRDVRDHGREFWSVCAAVTSASDCRPYMRFG